MRFISIIIAFFCFLSALVLGDNGCDISLTQDGKLRVISNVKTTVGISIGSNHNTEPVSVFCTDSLKEFRSSFPLSFVKVVDVKTGEGDDGINIEEMSGIDIKVHSGSGDDQIWVTDITDADITLKGGRGSDMFLGHNLKDCNVKIDGGPGRDSIEVFSTGGFLMVKDL